MDLLPAVPYSPKDVSNHSSDRSFQSAAFPASHLLSNPPRSIRKYLLGIFPEMIHNTSGFIWSRMLCKTIFLSRNVPIPLAIVRGNRPLRPNQVSGRPFGVPSQSSDNAVLPKGSFRFCWLACFPDANRINRKSSRCRLTMRGNGKSKRASSKRMMKHWFRTHP